MNNKPVIVGAMCISRDVEVLKITIPNLLKFCDWVLLLMDNETPEVKEYALEIQKQNYNKIWLRRSSIPHEVLMRHKGIADYRQRWKMCKGIVRDEMFVNLRRILQLKQRGYDKINILLAPDADECFTDYLPELLEEFWNSKYKAIAFKHIHPVNDFYTIKNDKMMSHVHAWKWTPELRGYPWQYRNAMHPIKWSETMQANYYSVHLCYLTENMRQWRNDNWKSVDLTNEKLYKLEKSVLETSPEEIKKILCQCENI